MNETTPVRVPQSVSCNMFASMMQPGHQPTHQGLGCGDERDRLEYSRIHHQNHYITVSNLGIIPTCDKFQLLISTNI